MEEEITQLTNAQALPEKREYRAPVFHRYGDIGDLTKTNGVGLVDDGGGATKT